jgi:hypothetical protein
MSSHNDLIVDEHDRFNSVNDTSINTSNVIDHPDQSVVNTIPIDYGHQSHQSHQGLYNEQIVTKTTTKQFGTIDCGLRLFATKRDVIDFIEYNYGQRCNKTLVQDRKYKGSTSVRYFCDSCSEFCISSNKSRPANQFLISSTSKLIHGSYDIHGNVIECRGVYKKTIESILIKRSKPEPKIVYISEAEKRAIAAVRRLKCPNCDEPMDETHDACSCFNINISNLPEKIVDSHALLSSVVTTEDDSV